MLLLGTLLRGDAVTPGFAYDRRGQYAASPRASAVRCPLIRRAPIYSAAIALAVCLESACGSDPIDVSGLKRSQARVRNVRHEHAARSMRDREWNLLLCDHSLRCDAARPEHGQLIGGDWDGVSVVGL